MEQWFFWSLTAINVLAIFVYFLIRREINYIVKSQIFTVGSDNAKWVITRRLKLFRSAYGFFLVILIALSYYIFILYGR